MRGCCEEEYEARILLKPDSSPLYSQILLFQSLNSKHKNKRDSTDKLKGQSLSIAETIMTNECNSRDRIKETVLTIKETVMQV